MAEIHWSDEAETHIAKHNVTPTEVEQVIMERHWAVSGREDTTLAFGQSNAGRYLLVVVAEALNGMLYVVTARDMTVAERRSYRRKAKL